MMLDRFADRLIGWYEAHKRDLPWRHTADPYRIWLSEIILQQTRVQQGLPYYERFVEAYPDVRALADAPEQEVLRLWQGLGYYSRARNLHATAKQVAYALGGSFPPTYQDLLSLKGVGKYTAAAIASFAYREPVAAVDGNVYRVLARLFGLQDDILSPQGQRTFAALAQELISPERPDLFNQAMMEFGAMHCTPANPACLFCPFGQECEARARGLQSELPVKVKRTKVRDRYFHYLVWEQGGHFLMRERTAGDIWQGLFDFMLLERQEDTQPEQLLQGLPEAELLEVAGPYKHQLTHQRLWVRFYRLLLPPDADLQALGRQHGLQPMDRDRMEAAPKPILVENYLRDYIYSL